MEKELLMEQKYDTKLGLLGAGEETFIRVQWPVGDVKQISEWLYQIASGQIFPLLLQHVEYYAQNTGDLKGLEEIKTYLTNKMKEHEIEDEDEPIVQPINAIRHIVNMFQNPGE